MTASSCDRVDEEAVDAVERGLLHRLPPALERHLDHAAAEPLDRVELRLRRVVGDDDRRRDARLARRPGDALRHVARARRDDARASSSGVRLRIAFVAPRILNEPIGWRFSSFSQISSAPRRRQPDERRPDRRARDPSRARARISSSGIKTRPSCPAPVSSRAAHDVLGGGEVLDGDAERLEHRELLRATSRPGAEPTSSSPSSAWMWPSRSRPPHGTGSRPPRSRPTRGGRRRRRVRRRVAVSSSRASGCMRRPRSRARRAPATRARTTGSAELRHRADDVGAVERLLDARPLTAAPTRPPAPRALLLRAARDPHSSTGVARHRLRCADRAWSPAPTTASTLRVLAREPPRRHAGHRSRADRGHRRCVHHREHLPGRAVVQRHRALVRVEPARRVVRHRRPRSSARTAAARRRGRSGIIPSRCVLAGRPDHRAQRQVHLAARERGERLLHRRDAARHVEEPLDVASERSSDRHAKIEPTSSRSSGVSSSASASRTGSRCAGRRGPTTTEATPGCARSQREREPGRADAALGRVALERVEPVVDALAVEVRGTARAASSSASPPAAPRRAGTCRSASRRRAGRTPGRRARARRRAGSRPPRPRGRAASTSSGRARACRRRAPRQVVGADVADAVCPDRPAAANSANARASPGSASRGRARGSR